MFKKAATLTSVSGERNNRIVYCWCFGVDNLTLRPPWWLESWCDQVNGTISLHQEYEEYIMVVVVVICMLCARHWVCEILSWERESWGWCDDYNWPDNTRTRTRTWTWTRGHSCHSVTLGSLPPSPRLRNCKLSWEQNWWNQRSDQAPVSHSPGWTQLPTHAPLRQRYKLYFYGSIWKYWNIYEIFAETVETQDC